MYIFELIVNYLKKDKCKDILKDYDIARSDSLLNYVPLEDNNSENSDEPECEHIFMPIDSDKEVLACTKCGMIKYKKDLKDVNFFHNHVK